MAWHHGKKGNCAYVVYTDLCAATKSKCECSVTHTTQTHIEIEKDCVRENTADMLALTVLFCLMTIITIITIIMTIIIVSKFAVNSQQQTLSIFSEYLGFLPTFLDGHLS